MELICNKNYLQKNLSIAEKHSAKESSIPSLKGVFIKADKDGLLIRSTNLETGFETKIPAKIIKEGNIIIPPKVVVGLISNVADEKIKLRKIKDSLNISTLNSSTTIKCYPDEDFPSIPKIKEKNKINFDSKELFDMLKGVYYSASQNDIKPEISSVYFNNKGNVLKLAATDSFRLSEKNMEGKFSGVFDFILPLKSAIELMRVIENYENSVDLMFDDNQLVVSGQNFVYFTKLVEGNFPDYNQIIPKSFSAEAVVSRQELLGVLKTSSVFSGRLNEVSMKLIPEDNIIEITTNDGDVGEHIAQVKSKITGEPMTISFNYRYVLDGLDPIVSKDIILRFNGQSRPLLVQNPEDTSYMYLVMPLKN